MVDGFQRLGHDPVIGRDDQDDEVGHGGPARPHRGEGGVPGGVDEGDLLAVHLLLIGADLLGDAPRLGVDDVGGADGVDESGLAVVDVAHDGHHRRARLKIGGVVLHLDVLEMGGVHRFLLLEVVVELEADHADGLVVEHLVDRDRLALEEKEFDDARHRDVDGLGKLGDAKGLGVDENPSVDLRVVLFPVGGAFREVADALRVVVALLLFVVLILHVLHSFSFHFSMRAFAALGRVTPTPERSS